MSDYRLIPLHGKHGEGKFAKVSPEDYEWLNQWRWSVSASGYAIRYASTAERVVGVTKTVYMHREVLGTPAGMDTDHANHNKLDNTRENIRVCTRMQNSRNMRRKRQSDFTTSYRGVTWRPRAKRWVAHISVGGKPVFLGKYLSDELAARAYDSAVLHESGEFAITNFSDSKPLAIDTIREAAGVRWLVGRSSVYRGVTWARGDCRAWRAVLHLTHPAKTIHLGYFSTEVEAARAYDRGILAASKRKSSAKLNFPRSDYT